MKRLFAVTVPLLFVLACNTSAPKNDELRVQALPAPTPTPTPIKVSPTPVNTISGTNDDSVRKLPTPTRGGTPDDTIKPKTLGRGGVPDDSVKPVPTK